MCVGGVGEREGGRKEGRGESGPRPELGSALALPPGSPSLPSSMVSPNVSLLRNKVEMIEPPHRVVIQIKLNLWHTSIQKVLMPCQPGLGLKACFQDVRVRKKSRPLAFTSLQQVLG